MEVQILRHPTEDDWQRCKMLALNTVGKKAASGTVSNEWKKKILRAEHSPIRTLMFTIKLVGVPYWVSVHFCRHKLGVEHYVCSQRNDRQDRYDRAEAPQNAPVDHIMDINAQALMQVARKRLCNQAAPETREAMKKIAEAVSEVNPEFQGLLEPQCRYDGGRCREMKPCGAFRIPDDWPF